MRIKSYLPVKRGKVSMEWFWTFSKGMMRCLRSPLTCCMPEGCTGSTIQAVLIIFYMHQGKTS